MSLKILNTINKIQRKKENAVTLLNKLILHGIMVNEQGFIKTVLKFFIKVVRQSKQYKEYIQSKKHLELTVIRQILTNPKFIQRSIEMNSTDCFNFFLKEFKVSYKDKIFESLETTKKMFTYVNIYGNLEILREIFQYYPKLYTEVLIPQGINEKSQRNRNEPPWISINCAFSNYRVLDFNLKIYEKKYGEKFMREQFQILRYLIFDAIKNKNQKIVKIISKYIDLSIRCQYQISDDFSSIKLLTPFEFACKNYVQGERTEILDEILANMSSNKDEIPIINRNKKCHILYMIKNQVPVQIISKVLAMFSPDVIANYRDKENKSFLYHAVSSQNMDIISILVPFYNTISYFEKATDGTTTEQVAIKSQNLELKKIIEDAIKQRETKEYLQKQWEEDPNVPERLLLLKRNLFPGMGINGYRQKCKYKFKIKDLPKAQRTKSQPKVTIQKFEKFSEYMWYKNMSAFQRKSMEKLKSLEQSSGRVSEFSSGFLVSPKLKSESDDKQKIGQIAQDPIKVNNEKKNSVFHQQEYRTLIQKGCTYLEISNLLDIYKTTEQLFIQIYKSQSLINEQPLQYLSSSQIFKNSKIIDNSDLIFLRQYPKQIRQSFNRGFYQKKLAYMPVENQNELLCAIKIFFQRLVNRPLHLGGTLQIQDELSEMMSSIIYDLTKKDIRYKEFKTQSSIDLNKMTITQRNEYEKHKFENKKVFLQIQKDYSQKLSQSKQSRKSVTKDQKDVDNLLSQNGSQKSNSNSHSRKNSQNSHQRNQSITDLINNHLDNQSDQKQSNKAAGNKKQSPQIQSKRKQSFIVPQIKKIPTLRIKRQQTMTMNILGAMYQQSQLSIQQDKTDRDASDSQNTKKQKKPKLNKRNSMLHLNIANLSVMSKKSKKISPKLVTQLQTSSSQPNIKRRNTTFLDSKLKPLMKLGKLSPKGNQSDEEIVEQGSRSKRSQNEISSEQKQEQVSDISVSDIDDDEKIEEQNNKIKESNNFLMPNTLNKIEEDVTQEIESPLLPKKKIFLQKNLIQKQTSQESVKDSQNTISEQMPSVLKGSMLKLQQTMIDDQEEQKESRNNVEDHGGESNNTESTLQQIPYQLNIRDKTKIRQMNLSESPTINILEQQNHLIYGKHQKNVNSQMFNSGTQQEIKLHVYNHDGFTSNNDNKISPLTGFPTSSVNQQSQLMVSHYFTAARMGSKNLSQENLKRSQINNISKGSFQRLRNNQANFKSFQSNNQAYLKQSLIDQRELNTANISIRKVKFPQGSVGLPPQPKKHTYIDVSDQTQPDNKRSRILSRDNLKKDQFKKYRYKNEEEETEIKRIIKNLNVLRWMRGSPIRLYPQYFSQNNSQVSLTQNKTYQTLLSKNNSQGLFTSQNIDKKSQNSQRSSIEIEKSQQSPGTKNIKQRIITRQVKNSIQQSKDGRRYIPMNIQSNIMLSTVPNLKLNQCPIHQLNFVDTMKPPLLSPNYEYDIFMENHSMPKSSKIKTDPQQREKDVDIKGHTKGKLSQVSRTKSSATQSKRTGYQKFTETAYEKVQPAIETSDEQESFAELPQYKGIEKSHKIMVDTLNASPNINDIIDDNKRFFKRLKNSYVEVPFQLQQELDKDEQIKHSNKTLKSRRTFYPKDQDFDQIKKYQTQK